MITIQIILLWGLVGAIIVLIKRIQEINEDLKVLKKVVTPLESRVTNLEMSRYTHPKACKRPHIKNPSRMITPLGSEFDRIWGKENGVRFDEIGNRDGEENRQDKGEKE